MAYQKFYHLIIVLKSFIFISNEKVAIYYVPRTTLSSNILFLLISKHTKW